jgi:hypothetical protein
MMKYKHLHREKGGRAAGLLVAGGVFGSVAASALATSIAPAPAQALDACVSALGASLDLGSAKCTSHWFNVAVGVGPNTRAIAAGGALGDVALALGANSYSSTAPQTTGNVSYFDIATAVAGGYAQASDGAFEIANALGSQPNDYTGAFATYGTFALARAIGTNAQAQTGSQLETSHRSAFNIARARSKKPNWA